MTVDNGVSVRFDDYLDADALAAALNAWRLPDQPAVFAAQLATAHFSNGLIERVDVSPFAFRAKEVGNERVLIDGCSYSLDIKPARLSILFLIGQSNMEGYVANSNAGAYDVNLQRQGVPDGVSFGGYSVANQVGQVYSSYGPNQDLTPQNACSYVPDTLCSTAQCVHEGVSHINALTAQGVGKSGMDSAIAHTWHVMTGDKVWVVNAAHAGSLIDTWIPERQAAQEHPTDCNFRSAQLMLESALALRDAEVAAGRFTPGNVVAFWNNGLSDASAGVGAAEYARGFASMYDAFLESGLEGLGIIMMRSSTHTPEAAPAPSNNWEGGLDYPDDLEMTGPRAAQFWLGSPACCEHCGVNMSQVHVVSTLTDDLAMHERMRDYFADRDPRAVNSYPTHCGCDISMPDRIQQLRPAVHYTQLADNEIGADAAANMLAILGRAAASRIGGRVCYWDENSQPLSFGQARARLLAGHMVVPLAQPLWATGCADDLAYLCEKVMLE